MSSITVRIPVPLRPFVGDADALDADAETVGAALEQIGGVAAERALRRALDRDDLALRPDVRAQVESALARMDG